MNVFRLCDIINIERSVVPFDEDSLLRFRVGSTLKNRFSMLLICTIKEILSTLCFVVWVDISDARNLSTPHNFVRFYLPSLLPVNDNDNKREERKRESVCLC